MIASSRHDESALATEVDNSLNNFLSDNFSRDMFDFLFNAYSKRRNFTLEDFQKYFTFEMI